MLFLPKQLMLPLFLFLPTLALAQYQPLADLPYDIGNAQNIGEYVNALYILAISIAAFLAVVKIIFGGVKYMLSDVVTDKGEAKKDIRGAIIGLLIVLAAALILQTINTSLTNLDVFSSAPVIENGTGSGTFSLWGGAYTGPPGILDNTIDLDNSTAQQIAQKVAACTINPGYVWGQSVNSYGRKIGECTRDDGSGVGSAGRIINSPADSATIQTSCHDANKPYIQNTTSLNGSDLTVGYCGTACNPQERLDTAQNTCVPYTVINPSIDCYDSAQAAANPQTCGATNVTLPGYPGYYFTFVKVDDNTVTMDCGSSLDLTFEAVCNQVCANGRGTLNGTICTFTQSGNYSFSCINPVTRMLDSSCQTFCTTNGGSFSDFNCYNANQEYSF